MPRTRRWPPSPRELPKLPAPPAPPPSGARHLPPPWGGANACHYLNVTGRRTVGTGHELPGTRWRSRCGPLEAFLEHVEAGIEHIPRDVQRRDVSHRRIATREQDQTVLVRVLLNRVTTLRIRLLQCLSATNSVACIIPSPGPSPLDSHRSALSAT